MAAGSASPPAVSDLREGWSGQAFTRVGECAPEKALQLAAEITSKLDDIKPLLGELDRLGWDGGGQPAYVNATKLDEVSRQYTVKSRGGEKFVASIGNVGPARATHAFIATRPPAHSGLCEQMAWAR